MIHLLYNFLGISNLDYKAKTFIMTYVLLMSIFIFLTSLTSTFYILFALDKLNGDYELYSSLVAVLFFIQAITDYPTGAVGDWIGQKWVIASASLFFGISFFFLANAHNYETLLISTVFLALGSAQQSGTFGAWFDNNYKHYVGQQDSNKQIYIEFGGKFGNIIALILGTSFIVGGLLITFSSREFVFAIQGVFFLIFALIFIFFFKDHENIERKTPNLKSYFNLLGDGFITTFNNKTLRILILGVVITSSGMSIWGNLILFPMYASYAKTDDFTGLLRAIIFFLGAILGIIYSANIKRVKNQKKLLANLLLISDAIFFIIFFLLFVFMPAGSETSIDFFKFSIVILCFIVGTFSMNIMGLLMPRFYLDLIPDENRNSVYSLLPTLIMIVSIFTVPIGGYLIKNYGIKFVLLLLAIWGLFGGMISSSAIRNYSKLEDIQELDEVGEIQVIA